MIDPMMFRVPVSVCSAAWLAGLRVIVDASPGDTPFHIILQHDKGETPLRAGMCVTPDDGVT